MGRFASRVTLVGGIMAAAAVIMFWKMFRMPGRSFEGEPPPLHDAEIEMRAELQDAVQRLAGEIGERHIGRFAALTQARDFIEHSFAQAGYTPRRVSYTLQGKLCDNIEVEISGGAEIIVIGAHYDTVPGSPGANDNASGIAALLALAKRFHGKPLSKTLRFVAFVNEEPFHFQSPEMGSWVYAQHCRQRGDNIVAMISLETIGYFSSTPGSQKYPVRILRTIYPGQGNFIAFVGNLKSAELTRRCIGLFREHASFPSEGAALPEMVPGVGWSDHWSFWQHGFEAIMVTDTAPFRYPHYHLPSDTPDKIDFDSMTQVVSGIERVIAELAHE